MICPRPVTRGGACWLVSSQANGRRGPHGGRIAGLLFAGLAAAFVARGQGSQNPRPPPRRAARLAPVWTRGATCYELFVRSFYDSDGDGIGDLKGAHRRSSTTSTTAIRTARHSLGARCIWLMPVDESPSYHGYDVTDYYRVARALGTNDDFKTFVGRGAQARDQGARRSRPEPFIERAPALPGGAARHGLAVPLVVSLVADGSGARTLGIGHLAQVTGTRRVLLRDLLVAHA